MGGIWKPAGRKRYRIWYKDHNGVRQTAPGYTDKAASMAKLNNLERDVDRRSAGMIVVDRERLKTPLKELIALYQADLVRQGTTPEHYKHQAGCLRRLAKWQKWTVLAQVQHDSLSRGLALLGRWGYAPRSINHYLAAWQYFCKWCVDNNYLQESPVGRVKRSRGLARPKAKRAPTMEEWDRLLAVARLHRRDLYFVASLTGLRRSELRRLEVRDVDLAQGKLRLRAEATKGHRADVVPLLPDVVPVLTRLCSGRAASERVFPRLSDARTFLRDLGRAGIVSPDATGRIVSFHSLRYFFCTLLARKLPIQWVRLLMRHKNINTTCRIYMDLGLDDLAEEVLQLPSFVGARPPAHPEG
jgi:integrase